MIDFADKIKNSMWLNFKDNGMQITNKGIDVENSLVSSLVQFLPLNPKIKVVANNTKRTIETANVLSKHLIIEDFVIDNFIFYNHNIDKEKSLLEVYKYLNSIDKEKLNKSKELIRKIALERGLDIFKKDFNIKEIGIKDNGFIGYKGELVKYSKISDVLITEFYETGKGDLEKLKLIAYPKELSLNIVSGIKPYCRESIIYLIESLKKFFNSKSEINTLLYVAHDSTIMAFCKSLGIELNLDRNLEPIPIGSKIIITQYEDKSMKYYIMYKDNIDFSDTIIKQI